MPSISKCQLPWYYIKRMYGKTVFQNLNQGLSRDRHDTGAVEEAQKGIWNICFCKLYTPPSQPLPVWIYPVPHPRRKVWDKYIYFRLRTCFSGAGPEVEETGSGTSKTRWIKAAFSARTHVALASWCVLVLSISSFQSILCMVSRVIVLKRKSDCNIISD